MYGITPNANIENLLIEPPVIAFAKSPKSTFFSVVTPGTGIVVPTMKMNKHNKVIIFEEFNTLLTTERTIC